MAATIDFSAFTTQEKTALLTAAKNELLLRAGVGSVQSGSGVGNSFQMMKMSTSELTAFINALSDGLGHTPGGGARVRPAFTCRG